MKVAWIKIISPSDKQKFIDEEKVEHEEVFVYLRSVAPKSGADVIRRIRFASTAY